MGRFRQARLSAPRCTFRPHCYLSTANTRVSCREPKTAAFCMLSALPNDTSSRACAPPPGPIRKLSFRALTGVIPHARVLTAIE